MKVLIVGAGMQGQVITWNLGRNPAVTEIVVADYDEKRAQFVAGQVGNGNQDHVHDDGHHQGDAGCELFVERGARGVHLGRRE